MPDIKKLLSSKEYQENEKFKIVQCEMVLKVIRVNRSDTHALKFLCFMINRATGKKKHEGVDDEEGQSD